MARISSSIVTVPSPLTSKAGQTLSGCRPRAMFTPMIRSSMLTMPLPAQSPGMVVAVGDGVGDSVPLGEPVADGVGVTAVVAVAVSVAVRVAVELAVLLAVAVKVGVVVAVADGGAVAV